MELTEPAAAVGLRNLNCREGTAEFEIRILSPRALGGWRCQSTAAEAVTVLEAEGMECRMEPMTFRSGCDCFELVILAGKLVNAREEIPEIDLFRVSVWDVEIKGVTDFTAVQDRGRRLIGTLNQQTPVGVTPGTRGWKLKMVQQIPEGGSLSVEPEEPFVLKVHEKGIVTSYLGCCWNSVTKILDQTRSRMVWEGFALSKTEGIDG